VSVIAWSQGNLDNQWALKYWPSTRARTSNLISISPDFHGTAEAYLLCPPGLLIVGCDPSVAQQEYKSKFVATLRANGGDSAYVPTTSIHSTTDEVVEPQQGIAASAFINDARGVGVSNSEIQTVCAGQPAGGIVTHEGAIANSLTFALAVDALTHSGPGSVTRLNLADVCSRYLAPGLDLNDFLLTESKYSSGIVGEVTDDVLDAIIIALLSLLAYVPKVLVEPPIRSYATY
jgi:hypothetical protein